MMIFFREFKELLIKNNIVEKDCGHELNKSKDKIAALVICLINGSQYKLYDGKIVTAYLYYSLAKNDYLQIMVTFEPKDSTAKFMFPLFTTGLRASDWVAGFESDGLIGWKDGIEVNEEFKITPIAAQV